MFCVIFLFSLFCARMTCGENFYYFDNVIIGNLKKREVIPLSRLNNPYGYSRRFFGKGDENDLKYRRSKDIRTPSATYLYELKDPNMRERSNNKVEFSGENNELRWLSIGTDESLDHHPSLMYIGPQGINMNLITYD